MGEKLALIDCYLNTGLAGVIISLYYGWKLTLVMLATSPLLFFSGAVSAMVGIYRHKPSSIHTRAHKLSRIHTRTHTHIRTYTDTHTHNPNSHTYTCTRYTH